ncbi:hypothetical protein Ahy_A01g002153 [Arachis hypogaea]|uniref:Uncharacterized protein n=1 Tax=Arachis hypogaea TaxID=3818 RepID=A0A445EQG3_ARAHY|nr:hypothetical protein Ahy_A01g002153 [Arachis hypogaea]
MARKGRFTKKAKSGPACQQSQKALAPAPSPTLALHQDESEFPQASYGDVHTTVRPFRPPRSEPRPAPQTRTYSSQNSELGSDQLDTNAHEVDSIDQEVDDRSIASRAQSRKGRKTTEYGMISSCKWSTTETYITIYNWLVDSDGTIKAANISVREAMERLNGRRIVLRFNNEKQPVGDEAGLLSGVLGMLGSDYGKFPICEESWRHVTTKEKVYFECVKSWKDTRLRLYDDYYEPTLSTEENTENRPPGIDRDHWRWYLDYRANPETKEKCIKSIKTAIYTHWRFKKPGLAEGRRGSSEQEGRIVSRGELWIKVHKRRDGSYINDEAREIGERLLEIEQEDESSRVLSQNGSLAQVFGREKPGRVRGVGLGPTPSQLFGTNLQPSVNRVLEEETQRKLNELQTELEAEKLKRKAMEDEAAADKKRIKVMESALIYLFQRQGEELPPEIAAGMC